MINIIMLIIIIIHRHSQAGIHACGQAGGGKQAGGSRIHTCIRTYGHTCIHIHIHKHIQIHKHIHIHILILYHTII